jgi:predicted ATPase
VVRDFLSELYDCALAPLRLPGVIQLSFDKVERTEFLYLFVRDLEGLRELAKRSLEIAKAKAAATAPNNALQQEVKAADFFKVLESTFMSDLIHETRIRVSVRHAGGLTFRELSEGEQQMLAVVGMLRFVRDDDSLFLLDEPDTHLNPGWGMEYLNILKTHANTGQNSHLLLATHDPLVLSNLRRSQVLMFERDAETGCVDTSEPEEDPVGMGVQGILRNMFGLRSAVGTETQDKLDRHASLLAFGKHRTPAQDKEFRRLGDELERAGFGREFRDPDYASFLRAMARRPEFRKPVLTSQEIKQQEVIADQILEGVLAQDKKRKGKTLK